MARFAIYAAKDGDKCCSNMPTMRTYLYIRFHGQRYAAGPALPILRLKRQAALSGIYCNIGFTGKGARKQFLGKFVLQLGLDSPL